MKLVEFVSPVPHPLWKLCLQMGITDVIVKVNPSLTGLPDPWKYETLKSIVDRLSAAGLTVVGLEGDPFDMTPIKQFGERTLLSVPHTPRRTDTPVRSSEEREEALAHYRELLESMSRLGIRLLCYNFMVGPGWSRTGVREVRGGAFATCFSVKDLPPGERTGVSVLPASRCLEERTGVSVLPASRCPEERTVVSVLPASRCHGERTLLSVPPHDSNPNGQECPFSALRLTKDEVWANYEYFIKSVMPTAERLGVRMGLHPDDPCLPSLGEYARIFETVADYDRAYEIYPSPSNAVTFCQANFKLMGADLIKAAEHFGKRIAFIHVRDVEGDKYDFTELFHDQGDTDQFALMRVYRELGLDVPVRGDHVPEMEGDRRITEDAIPGYFCLGRLFANGYLKALLKGTEK